MIDIKFLRENPDIVRENIKKKFQDAKLPLVDEVIELDAEKRATQQKADSLRASRNKLSKQIGALMGQGKKAEAEEVKAQVKAQSDELIAAEAKEKELDEKILKIMMTIPNIIDASVPVGSTRSVAYRLFDGVGMASASQEIAISLAASAPAASLALDEFTPEVNLTESQSRVEAVLDGAVSLVQGAGSLDGAVLTVSFVANGRPSDELGIVADGSEAADRRLERVLFNDPATGVMRHADAGYPLAVETAREVGLNLPMIG